MTHTAIPEAPDPRDAVAATGWEAAWRLLYSNYGTDYTWNTVQGSDVFGTFK